MRKDQELREFAIVILSNLFRFDAKAARIAALQPGAISCLIVFLEVSTSGSELTRSAFMNWDRLNKMRKSSLEISTDSGKSVFFSISLNFKGCSFFSISRELTTGSTFTLYKLQFVKNRAGSGTRTHILYYLLKNGHWFVGIE